MFYKYLMTTLGMFTGVCIGGIIYFFVCRWLESRKKFPESDPEPEYQEPERDYKRYWKNCFIIQRNYPDTHDMYGKCNECGASYPVMLWKPGNVMVPMCNRKPVDKCYCEGGCKW